MGVFASDVFMALRNAKEKGMEPERVLCPFEPFVEVGTKASKGVKVSAKDVFGVEIGYGSEVVVLVGNGCLSVWGDHE